MKLNICDKCINEMTSETRIRYDGEVLHRSDKVSWTCLTHGIYYQTVANHCNTDGSPRQSCYKCSQSRNQCSRHYDYERRYRESMSRLEEKIANDPEYLTKHNYQYNSDGKLVRVANMNQDRIDWYNNEIAGGLIISDTEKPKYRGQFNSDLIEYLDTYNLPYHKLTLPSGFTLQFYFPTKGVAINPVCFFDNADVQPNQLRDPSKKRFLESIYLEARSIGIRVITVMDYHYYSRPEKIKGIVRYALTPAQNKYFARKCDCVWIDRKLASEFLKKYHVDGNSGSAQHALAMVPKGEEPTIDNIIQVTTWSGMRMGRGSKDDWELARMANRRDCVCIGGTSKMFKEFITQIKPHKILSYHDNTIFDGSGYEAVGMQDDGQTGASYGYCRFDGSMCKTWIHRETIQVHKLRTAFPQLTQDIEDSHRDKDGRYLPGMEFSIASAINLYSSNDCGNTRHVMLFEDGWQIDINDGHKIKQWF